MGSGNQPQRGKSTKRFRQAKGGIMDLIAFLEIILVRPALRLRSIIFNFLVVVIALMSMMVKLAQAAPPSEPLYSADYYLRVTNSSWCSHLTWAEINACILSRFADNLPPGYPLHDFSILPYPRTFPPPVGEYVYLDKSLHGFVSIQYFYTDPRYPYPQTVQIPVFRDAPTEVPETYTLTLTPDQPSTEPSASLDLTVAVENQDHQPPKKPVPVKISLKVDPKSGGHDHGDNTRPRGYIDNIKCETDGTCKTLSIGSEGSAIITFKAPTASGQHTITATCDRCSNTATKQVNVKVDWLKPIPPSGLYALYETDGSVIGAARNMHESNHYLTPIAANQLLVLAINYHHRYPNNPVLHINDASLIWGGKFDLSGKWTGYHYEHDKGTVVDVRANTNAGNIPEENFTDLENMASGQGLDAQLHCSATRNPSIDNCAGDTNRHYHIILN